MQIKLGRRIFTLDLKQAPPPVRAPPVLPPVQCEKVTPAHVYFLYGASFTFFALAFLILLPSVVHSRGFVRGRAFVKALIVATYTACVTFVAAFRDSFKAAGGPTAALSRRIPPPKVNAAPKVDTPAPPRLQIVQQAQLAAHPYILARRSSMEFSDSSAPNSAFSSRAESPKPCPTGPDRPMVLKAPVALKATPASFPMPPSTSHVRPPTPVHARPPVAMAKAKGLVYQGPNIEVTVEEAAVQAETTTTAGTISHPTLNRLPRPRRGGHTNANARAAIDAVTAAAAANNNSSSSKPQYESPRSVVTTRIHTSDSVNSFCDNNDSSAHDADKFSFVKLDSAAVPPPSSPPPPPGGGGMPPPPPPPPPPPAAADMMMPIVQPTPSMDDAVMNEPRTPSPPIKATATDPVSPRPLNSSQWLDTQLTNAIHGLREKNYQIGGPPTPATPPRPPAPPPPPPPVPSPSAAPKNIERARASSGFSAPRRLVKSASLGSGSMLQDIKHAASSLRSPPKAQFRGRPSGDHGPAAAMTDSKTIQAMLAREASMRASSRDLSGTYGEGFLPKANRVNSPTPSWAKDQNGMLRSDSGSEWDLTI